MKTYIQTCTQTHKYTKNIYTCRHIDKQTDIHTNRHTDRHTYTQKYRRTQRYTYRHTNILIYKQTYRHIDTHTHTCTCKEFYELAVGICLDQHIETRYNFRCEKLGRKFIFKYYFQKRLKKENVHICIYM
jgi:hypothetical protein